MAESSPGKKRNRSSCWALLSLQGTRAPHSGFPTLFNGGFGFLFIYLFYRNFVQHLLSEPGWVPGCKTHKSIGSLLWLGPHGVFNSQSCLRWISSNLSVTVWVFLPWASLVAQTVKHLPTMRGTRVRSLGRGDPLEGEMATHSSILAWRIPWTEDPGRLQSMGSQRVRHDWATSLHFFTLAPLCTFESALGSHDSLYLPVCLSNLAGSGLSCVLASLLRVQKELLIFQSVQLFPCY